MAVTTDRDPLMVNALGPVAPRWGGDTAAADAAGPPHAPFQSTTVQLAGLYPFVAGSGSPPTACRSAGTCCGTKSCAWTRCNGCATAWSPTPASSSSATRRRQVRAEQTADARHGRVRRQTDGARRHQGRKHTAVIEDLAGQVVRRARHGPDQPAGLRPLGRVINQLPVDAREQLLLEVRADGCPACWRCACWCAAPAAARSATAKKSSSVRRSTCSPNAWTRATRPCPDVLRLIREPTAELIAASEEDPEAFRAASRELRQTLSLLLEGPMKGVFDGATTRRWTSMPRRCRWTSPGRGRRRPAGRRGDPVHVGGRLPVRRRRRRVGRARAAARQQFFMLQDEGWRALRGAAGLVDHADALTTGALEGHRQHVRHPLAARPEALPTEEDRAKSPGFVDRSRDRDPGRVADEGAQPGLHHHPSGRRPRRTWLRPGRPPKAGKRRRRAPRPRQVPGQDLRAARCAGADAP